MLLLGEPGIGKTHFARKIAQLLGTGYGFVPMSSLTAGWVLSGASSQWKNAKPGKVFDTFLNGDYANPVIVVDEIDKASADGQYDPLGALYELLEIETATRFVDEFVEVPIDASGAVWLATANDAARIPEPLAQPPERLRDRRAGRRRRAPHRAQRLPRDPQRPRLGQAASRRRRRKRRWRGSPRCRRARCAAPDPRGLRQRQDRRARRGRPGRHPGRPRQEVEDRVLEVGEQPPAGDHRDPDQQRGRAGDAHRRRRPAACASPRCPTRQQCGTRWRGTAPRSRRRP